MAQFTSTSANNSDDIQLQQPSTSDLSNDQKQVPTMTYEDCECSDAEEFDNEEIFEKQERISLKNASKITRLSKDSDSPFEEVFVEKSSHEDWLLVQKKNEVTSIELPSTSSTTHRRRSDSDLNLNNISTPLIYNPKNIKVSCKKCGRAKTKIKQEILKLSEQLKVSDRTEEEINANIQNFKDYLQTMRSHESSEATKTLGIPQNIPDSGSNDEIDVLDENEEINEFPSTSGTSNNVASTYAPPKESKRFISLNDIQSNDELELMSVKQLKEVLMLNRVDFRGCCEKNELKERVRRLWQSYKSAPCKKKIIFIFLISNQFWKFSFR